MVGPSLLADPCEHMSRKRKLLLITLLLGAGMAMWQCSQPSERMFEGEANIHPETGRKEMRHNIFRRPNGTLVLYDRPMNILLVARSASHELGGQVPTREGDRLIGHFGDISIPMPCWKNSALLYDRNGIVKILYIHSESAGLEAFSQFRSFHETGSDADVLIADFFHLHEDRNRDEADRRNR